MKITVVPAQVTTVEDRVAGNLSFMQLILLAVPVFGGSLLYAVLPPSMSASIYKLILVSALAAVCLLLAIRIKGRITLLWLVVLLRYQSRPRHYLFTKNSSAYREYHSAVPDVDEVAVDEPIIHLGRHETSKLTLHEVTAAHETLIDPLSRVRFKTTKKGGLYVQLSEVQE